MLLDTHKKLQQSLLNECLYSHEGIANGVVLLLLQILANLLDNKTCRRHCMCTSHVMTCLGLLDLITPMQQLRHFSNSSQLCQ